MKNIIDEKPSSTLHGRLKYTVDLVKNSDIKNRSILNIGCGYGWFELNVLERGVKKIIGTEITDIDLETPRKNIRNKRADFTIGSAIDLPFQSDTFDTVVSWEVLEHIPLDTEDKMFQEVYRVLKNGGVFYLSTPYDSFYSKIFDPAWWLIKHRHYSKKKLHSYAKKAGFKNIQIYTKGAWWNIIYSLNMYTAKWIFRRQPFFQKMFQKKEDEDYKKDEGFVTIYGAFKK